MYDNDTKDRASSIIFDDTGSPGLENVFEKN